MTAQHHEFEIIVFTCQKADGTWTAEGAVRHDMEHAIRPIPLLEGPSAEFPSENEARDYALHAAREWLDEQYPSGRAMRDSAG